MTTIAYHHGSRTIAADGRACLPDGMIITDTDTKIIHCVNGDVVAASGDVPLIETVIDLWADGFTDEDLSMCQGMSMSAIIYFADTDKFVSYNIHTMNGGAEQVQWDLYYNYAVGSGDAFALAAMDHGSTAIESVHYAMTRDSGTGGTVEAFTPEVKE